MNISPLIQDQLLLSKKLSNKAKNAIVLLELKSLLLISLGQLCNNNCQVLLDKKKLTVCKENEIMLEGIRNLTDGL